jgi:hypothetical protein
MTRFNRIAAAALAAGALGLAAPAFAEQILADGTAYPRIVGSGENASVEYGAASTRNIVGGGAVAARDVAGGGANVRHFDDRFVQPGRVGVRAVTVGSGENQRTVWVPVNGSANAASVPASLDRG